MIETITGVILAGGRSTRMGTDKALLVYNGRPLVDTVIETMSAIFRRVVLSVRPSQILPATQLPQIVDCYADSGPLGGITSVLESEQRPLFCVACDMPFLDRALIEDLCAFEGHDAVLPVWNARPQPLHAKYSVTVTASFQQAIRERRLKITDALQGANVRCVPIAEGNSFRNINTPEDYQELTAKARRN